VTRWPGPRGLAAAAAGANALAGCPVSTTAPFDRSVDAELRHPGPGAVSE
jgi:hypothetical protein